MYLQLCDMYSFLWFLSKSKLLGNLNKIAAKFFLKFFYISTDVFEKKRKRKNKKFLNVRHHTLASWIYSQEDCQSKTINILKKQFKKRFFTLTLFYKLNKLIYSFTDDTVCMQYISILPILY